MTYKLKQCGWWDEDDPEHLVYFRIVDSNNKEVWMSSWCDTRDLEVDVLREQVVKACKEFGIVVDLSSDDYWDWTG